MKIINLMTLYPGEQRINVDGCLVDATDVLKQLYCESRGTEMYYISQYKDRHTLEAYTVQFDYDDSGEMVYIYQVCRLDGSKERETIDWPVFFNQLNHGNIRAGYYVISDMAEPGVMSPTVGKVLTKRTMVRSWQNTPPLVRGAIRARDIMLWPSSEKTLLSKALSAYPDQNFAKVIYDNYLSGKWGVVMEFDKSGEWSVISPYRYIDGGVFAARDYVDPIIRNALTVSSFVNTRDNHHLLLLGLAERAKETTVLTLPSDSFVFKSAGKFDTLEIGSTQLIKTRETVW